MLKHKFLTEVALFLLVLGAVWIIIRYRYKDIYFSLKGLKPIYRILIYIAIAAILYLFLTITTKFGIVAAIIIIGLPGALLAFLK